jgi:hypothetical protein
MKRVAIALVFSCFVALAIGCARKDAGAYDPGPAVDVELMAFLSEARALHHEANLKEDAGDVKGAIAIVDRLVHTTPPHPGTKLPEVEEVLADGYARLAELKANDHDLEGSAAAVQSGLSHASEPTYFRGHLLEVGGVAEEARASSLADAGKTDEAARARAHAMDLLEEAVKVQEGVVGRALDGGANGGKR